jgi:hypothetical protein
MLATLKDGEANLTTFEYDGFGITVPVYKIPKLRNRPRSVTRKPDACARLGIR